MDSGQDQVILLHKSMNRLIMTVKGMKKMGRLLALSDQKYKISERKESFTLHDNGVAWTAVRNLALGNETVAELKYKRDRCQYAYDTQRELIYAIKTEIRIIEGEIRQDLGKGG